uniref:Uncharacterized protein n=1 Tax=Glaesserella parasuis TaxID=738 RepID=A0A3S5XHJ2_GLAPU|nr:hypothetical protein [Glaesserella parasuis]QBB00149.1 hypothetical protein [Glaesserella parasuis]
MTILVLFHQLRYRQFKGFFIKLHGKKVYGFSQRCTDFNKIHLKAFNTNALEKKKGSNF